MPREKEIVADIFYAMEYRATIPACFVLDSQETKEEMARSNVVLFTLALSKLSIDAV